MVFAGLQKMTLLDYPGRVACTVFTAGCNLRCPFCHNASLIGQAGIPSVEEDEILSYLKKRKGVLEGVVITGGEPLLHKELGQFLRRVKELGYCVKLDTNGTCPAHLRQLVTQGLVDYVAMDVKNGPSCYPLTTGKQDLELSAITQSRDFLLEGTVDYEFRTTVVRGLHTRETLREAADWIRGARVWYLQQFVDHGTLLAPKGLGAYTAEEMEAFARDARDVLPNVQCRGI